MSDFHVQKQVYEQIDTKYPPVLACSSGSVFMYSTANGLLRLFYTQPEINVNLLLLILVQVASQYHHLTLLELFVMKMDQF